MARPGTIPLLRQQTGYQAKIFFRTPIAAFFTLIFPLMLLFLFGALFGTGEIPELGITFVQFFTPALAVFSAANATFSNIGVGTAYQRDEGILKRVRGTPLPAWIFMGGKIVASTLIAAMSVVLMMGVGVLVYGIEIYPRSLPAATVTFLVGTACFASLGLLVAAVSPTGNAATAITNATLLPLAFLSGLFIPITDSSPAWLTTVADIFPLSYFHEAFAAAFLPGTTGAQFDWGSLGYMALWGVVALLLGIRWFKWEKPVSSGRRAKVKTQS